ncbi:MAG TPA: alpha/beta fold hydrolase [Caldilineaceae bacterium]|nr:alpha/beta fold hydrolase [Caldilineaceae bacterium]
MTTTQSIQPQDLRGATSANRHRSWRRRLFTALLVLIGVLAIAGMVYQTAGAWRDRTAFPAPGQFVDVGGYRLHLYCTGQAQPGQPTVILETLAGGMSAYWGWVQPEIAKTTRVCSYGRAGRAWSEPATQPLSLQQTVNDLHTLLQKGNVPGPYVLVGHSIGGLYVRKFAADYPDEVAGMVLLDAAHPDQLKRYPELAAESKSYLRLSAVFPLLARLGIVRFYFATGGVLDMGDLPPAQQEVAKAVWSSPAYFTSQRAEVRAAPSIYAAAGALGSLGDLPLVVLSAGSNQPPFWAGLQDELAALSSNSRHITNAQATHQSLAFNEGDALITSRQILAVVEAVVSGQSLRQ